MSVSLDNLEPIDVRPIKRALISVYDKTGLEDLARALGEAGVEIVSTGSTAARIAAAGVAVTPVDDVTGFPEVLEGRVKTLHPFIHSGILADQRKAAHREQIGETRHVVDRGHRHASGRNTSGRGARGDDLHAGLAQRARKVLQARLVIHRNQGPLNRAHVNGFQVVQ